MDPLTILLGVMGLAFFLFLFGYLGDEPGGLLRMVVWTFAIILLLFIPWLVNMPTCEVVVKNETVSGNFTAYEYDSFCYENLGKIGTSFLKIVTWLYRIFVFYIIISLFIRLKEYLIQYKAGRR
jgi:hypothetical protein